LNSKQQNENNKFDGNESLATSAYVQVQRCDPVYVNTIPSCCGWIDRETGSITIDVHQPLVPPLEYSIIASENKIYFSLDQYRGRSSDISTGDMKDGAEFWVGMTYFERKSKDLTKTPTLINRVDCPKNGLENNNEFHVLFIQVDQDERYVAIPYTITVNGRSAFTFFYWIGLVKHRTYGFKIVNTNEITIELQGCPHEWTTPFSEEFDLSEYGTFIRFKASVKYETIEIVE